MIAVEITASTRTIKSIGNGDFQKNTTTQKQLKVNQYQILKLLNAFLNGV